MKVLRAYIGLVAIVSVLFTASADPTLGQANRYARDGLSFSYPTDWSLTDESNGEVQTLSLDRGKDEARILVVSPRRQMNAGEIAQKQSIVTEAIVTNLAGAIENLGAQVQRTAISATISGIQAQGIGLRASMHGEVGSVDVYQLVLGDRLVNVIFIGSDPERLRGTNAWDMVCRTLSIAVSATPKVPVDDASPRIPGAKVDIFQDSFNRADSTWVGSDWREYTRRNDQVQATDSPWRIHNGTLYFEAVGANSYIEDFIETTATFPVDNVRVQFELRARVATSAGYVGPTMFWSGLASERGGSSNVRSGPGQIGVAAFNSWETGGARGFVIATHGGAQVYKDYVLSGVNQSDFSSISITVRNGQITYEGQNSPALTVPLARPIGGGQRHWTFGARLYDAGVQQVIEIRNLRITAL